MLIQGGKAAYVKITRNRLCFLLFSFLFSFSFDLFFIFQFLEHLGLGLEVIGHNIDHRTWEKEVEDSRTK